MMTPAPLAGPGGLREGLELPECSDAMMCVLQSRTCVVVRAGRGRHNPVPVRVFIICDRVALINGKPLEQGGFGLADPAFDGRDVLLIPLNHDAPPSRLETGDRRRA